jgi:RNA polymerase sigma factor (sigma-70 family)
MTPATDLIDTAQRREENLLYKQLYPQFVSYYSAHLHKYPLAKELASAAIGKVMTKLKTYDKALPLQNWAMRIASNHLIDYFRQQASAKHQLVQLFSGGAGDEDGDYDAQDQLAGFQAPDQEYRLLEGEVHALLADWPGVAGQVLRANLLDGHEAAALATMLGLSEKKAKRILSEAKQALREELRTRAAEEIAPAYV